MEDHLIKMSKGAGLIEVLVALSIVSIGLLGLAKMQLLALSHTQYALQTTQALLAAGV